ncbi:TonB family protein [Paraburkholderia sediminicola]|uniref:energy transducer TonB n=3 Tax=Burkholderiaceae TaxID=119060 RepID=UPI0038BB8ED8
MATTGYTAIDAARRCRIGVALGAVIAAHAGLLVWALAVRDRMVERTVEEPTIVAALLRDEPEAVAPAVPAPAAVIAAPQTGHPPIRSKPMPQPRLKEPRSAAAPAPTLPTASPSRDTAPSPGPAAPPLAAAPSPAAPATNASATELTVPASSTPKSVSHVDCGIPKPDYPDVSKRRNESGTAIVRFVVGLSGHIETAQLQKSSGYPRLDDAALAAIHAGVCQPYRENGEAVRAAYSQSFVFGLTD